MFPLYIRRIFAFSGKLHVNVQNQPSRITLPQFAFASYKRNLLYEPLGGLIRWFIYKWSFGHGSYSSWWICIIRHCYYTATKWSLFWIEHKRIYNLFIFDRRILEKLKNDCWAASSRPEIDKSAHNVLLHVYIYICTCTMSFSNNEYGSIMARAPLKWCTLFLARWE